MKGRALTQLANRLALSLASGEGASLRLLQVRLARVLSRLWELFAELLESHAALTSGRETPDPVELADFRPGDTLRLRSSFVRTDPRLVLAERMNIDGWASLIGELAGAVLHAPDLARQELLTVFADLDEEVLREIAARLGDEEDTDAFPAQPSREAHE
jgi:hypothetical protein